ncbi:uncharacterized protein LOC120700028 isoform X2 [Panicum virgatum]|uniref:uncharacterized protein LOC120700028 isoform X2 n=1 Tax=Panicum virgatum TaxID=38727 RepID=UPI0019D66B5F|nr:uncharacterized protein LOC120700028 isoform X2 [Panicum virgatum]
MRAPPRGSTPHVSSTGRRRESKSCPRLIGFGLENMENLISAAPRIHVMLQPDRVHLIVHSMSRGRPISWHPKMAALPLPDKQNLLDLFREYDHDMQQQSDRIARAHRAIVARQIELKETFGDMIDELIRVRDDDKHASQDPKQDGREQAPQHNNVNLSEAEAMQGSADRMPGDEDGNNESDDACVSPRPTLALPDDQLTDTQFARRIDYLVGDQIGRESFDDAEPRSGHQDGKSDDKDEEARAERNDRDQHIINSSIDTGTPSRWINLQHPEGSNTPNSMLNTDIEKGGSSGSIRGGPLYDKTPFDPTCSAEEERREQQNYKEAAAADSHQGPPVFDASVPKKTILALSKDAGTSGSSSSGIISHELESRRRLVTLLTSADSPLHKKLVMNYGDGLAYGYDTMKSFADGLHLEDLFVQFAIECITHDNEARGLPEASSVILSVPVMRQLNAEHIIHNDQPATPFTLHALEDILNAELPSTQDLKNTQLDQYLGAPLIRVVDLVSVWDLYPLLGVYQL